MNRPMCLNFLEHDHNYQTQIVSQEVASSNTSEEAHYFSYIDIIKL
jgi:hypothetical protein